MSNRPKLKPPGRNLRVAVARAAAEVSHGFKGSGILRVYHDGWCPAVTRLTMKACVCSPEMVIEPVETDLG